MKGYCSIENSCCISNCLSSSRLKMIRRRGLYFSITVLTKCLPKEPVPPVTRTDLSLRSSQGWVKSRKIGSDCLTVESCEISLAAACAMDEKPLLSETILAERG